MRENKSIQLYTLIKYSGKVGMHSKLLSIIKIAFIFLILHTTLIVKAQTVFKEISDYNIINTNINTISLPGDSSDFMTFFDKLDKLFLEGEGNINIVHFGGSHIQADIISNRLRTNLIGFHPGITASRGFVFPYSAAKTNNPYNYITRHKGKWEFSRNIQRLPDLPLGIAGIAIETEDSTAELQIKLRNNNAGYEFNRIRMLSPILQYDSLVFMKINDTTLVYPLTDTIQGTYTFHLNSYGDSFVIVFKQPDSLSFKHIVRGFLLENDFYGISYHSFGVNGASVPSYLRCIHLTDELKLIKPDLVIFSIGINDAAAQDFDVEIFKNNYSELIRRVKESSPGCAILFTSNNDSYRRIRRRYSVNENGLIVSKAFAELATIHGGGIWDVFNIMGGLRSMAEWETAGLAKRDKIHFTHQGYLLLGDLLYNAIVQAYLERLEFKSGTMQ